MSSKEVPQSINLGSIKTSDLLYAIEVKAFNKYPPANQSYNTKRTDKMADVDSMTIAQELAKRMEQMTPIDIDNNLIWLKPIQRDIAPNKDEALNNLIAAFETLKEQKTKENASPKAEVIPITLKSAEIKKLQTEVAGEVANDVDDIINPS